MSPHPLSPPSRNLDPQLERFAAEGLNFPQEPTAQGLVRCDDASVAWFSFGSGRPVVLLHGGMGNSTQWAGQLEALLQAGRQVVLIDTRGHGRSTTGRQAFSYRLFSRDVLAVLNHLALAKVDLVGWSDGACTALVLARHDPARVGRVVFFACNVDPTGTKPFLMTPTIGNCLHRHALDYERLAPGPDRFEDLGPRLEPLQKSEPNYSAADLAAIEVPVAVLHAEHDEFIHEAHARYLAATLPHATFELLPGVSHFAPVQNPRLFNAALHRALQ